MHDTHDVSSIPTRVQSLASRAERQLTYTPRLGSPQALLHASVPDRAASTTVHAHNAPDCFHRSGTLPIQHLLCARSRTMPAIQSVLSALQPRHATLHSRLTHGAPLPSSVRCAVTKGRTWRQELSPDNAGSESRWNRLRAGDACQYTSPRMKSGHPSDAIEERAQLPGCVREQLDRMSEEEHGSSYVQMAGGDAAAAPPSSSPRPAASPVAAAAQMVDVSISPTAAAPQPNASQGDGLTAAMLSEPSNLQPLPGSRSERSLCGARTLKARLVLAAYSAVCLIATFICVGVYVDSTASAHDCTQEVRAHGMCGQATPQP